jgi:hypothetical protein
MCQTRAGPGQALLPPVLARLETDFRMPVPKLALRFQIAKLDFFLHTIIIRMEADDESSWPRDVCPHSLL